MASERFCFDVFRLDPGERRLTRDGARVDLNGRYLDALALLVRECGQLVSKERFLDEVWRGVPVTDEALTQCIATLRRQLGDSASAPRFIETVPKHGYRFIAPVTIAAPASSEATPSPILRSWLIVAAAGTVSGGVAGLFGGLLYGFVGASLSPQAGVGAASLVLVLACLTLLVGLLGGAGVAFGIAAASHGLDGRWGWQIVGGAIGGLLVGAFVKLLGIDAFALLFGQSPGDVTGAVEGACLGAAVGLASGWTSRRGQLTSWRQAMAAAAVTTGVTGAIVTALGGRLMGGSLDLVARSFPGSQLRLEPIAALLGESGFGPLSQIVTGALEAALFGSCVAGAMAAAAQRLLHANDAR